MNEKNIELKKNSKDSMKRIYEKNTPNQRVKAAKDRQSKQHSLEKEQKSISTDKAKEQTSLSNIHNQKHTLYPSFNRTQSINDIYNSIHDNLKNTSEKIEFSLYKDKAPFQFTSRSKRSSMTSRSVNEKDDEIIGNKLKNRKEIGENDDMIGNKSKNYKEANNDDDIVILGVNQPKTSEGLKRKKKKKRRKIDMDESDNSHATPMLAQLIHSMSDDGEIQEDLCLYNTWDELTGDLSKNENFVSFGFDDDDDNDDDGNENNKSPNIEYTETVNQPKRLAKRKRSISESDNDEIVSIPILHQLVLPPWVDMDLYYSRDPNKMYKLSNSKHIY